MFKRKGRTALPLGHKPRGQQRVRFTRAARAGATARVRYGAGVATQAPAGTQTSTTPGVFSSAAGGSGYRTLEAPPLARAPIQRTTLGFFAPFAVRAGPVLDTPAVPFAAPARQPAPPATPARSTVFPAPVVYTAQPVGQPVKLNPQRSDVFPVPR